MRFYEIILSIIIIALPLLGLFFIARLITGGFRGKNNRAEFIRNEALGWKSSGLISQEQYDRILNLYHAPEKKKLNLIKVIMFCGAVFLALGVLLFVSSNWDKISNLNRTIILLSATFAVLFTGYYYTAVNQALPALGKALVFLAAVMWGATIILIAQIYHIPSTGNWVILLLWGFPILPLALFLNNRAVLWGTAVIFGVWNFAYSYGMSAANYYYPLMVFLILLPVSRKDTPACWLNISGLILAAWYSPFLKYEWAALLIASGLLIYHLLSGEKKHLAASALAFPAWYIAFFAAHKTLPDYFSLVPVIALIYFSVREKDDISFVLALCGGILALDLLLWRVFCPAGFSYSSEGFFLFCFHITLGTTLFLLKDYLKDSIWPGGYKALTLLPLVLVFIPLYSISFKAFAESVKGDPPGKLEIFIMLFTGAALAMFVYGIFRKIFSAETGRHEKTGITLVLISLACVYLSTNLPALMTLEANIALFGLTIIMLLYGKQAESPAVFNFGLLLFGVATLMRYSDVGWQLMSRSMFFLLGGLILIGLGLLFEWNRRSLAGKTGEQR